MMDWTDRHCRYFHRLLSRHARLYTEMLTTGAVIFGDRDRLMGFIDGVSRRGAAAKFALLAAAVIAAAIGAIFIFDAIWARVGFGAAAIVLAIVSTRLDARICKDSCRLWIEKNERALPNTSSICSCQSGSGLTSSDERSTRCVPSSRGVRWPTCWASALPAFLTVR